MHLVAKSDQTTGNQTYCSYAIQSNELVFAFTAPYSSKIDQTNTKKPHPGFHSEEAREFSAKHGLAVRAVGVLVDDAHEAYRVSVENGAVSVLAPQVLTDELKGPGGKMVIAEVKLYGDVVLRYVSNQGFKGSFLPNYEDIESLPLTYGLVRLDHAVGNVHKLAEAVQYVTKFTGFHPFAEFTADDVGTMESGLNSMVLASNNEMVLLPLNEPTFGTKRKSQIQTYLEHNEGPGLQHLALICDDIFSTLREMRTRTQVGGFDFMPKPPPTYYKNMPKRVGSVLTEQQIKDCEQLGILVDKDDQGVLLQIFTKPIGDRHVTWPLFFINNLISVFWHPPCQFFKSSFDCISLLVAVSFTSFSNGGLHISMFLCYKHATWRWYLTWHIFDTFCRPTIFIEVIQRVGCMEKNSAGVIVQKGGCGGFGKGNFSELFKSIEEYEKTLDGTLQAKSEWRRW